MPESVYKIIELVGTSTESWEKAAKTAVERAAKTLRDIRVAEIAQLDLTTEDGKVVLYRAKVKVSFKYETSHALSVTSFGDLATSVVRRTLHGHEIAYRTAGSGPVVLLVHGMAGSSATWRHVIPALAERYTVVAPDLLGHGESAKPRGDYSLGAHASLLRDLLNALGHERATCIGQSLGGGIVLQFAYQFPERCERIVLVGSGGLGNEVNPLLRALTAPFAETVLSFVCTPTIRDAVARLGGVLGHRGLRLSPAGEEMWRSYASLAEKPGRQAFFRTLRSVVDLGGQAIHAGDRFYLAAHLPTLIVWGDRDPFIPHEHGSSTHAAIPGSRLEIFPGVGHYPHCEDPARFVAVVRDFIESTEGAVMSERHWREQFRATHRMSALGDSECPVTSATTARAASSTGPTPSRFRTRRSHGC